jgi:hypothetical protein
MTDRCQRRLRSRPPGSRTGEAGCGKPLGKGDHDERGASRLPARRGAQPPRVAGERCAGHRRGACPHQTATRRCPRGRGIGRRGRRGTRGRFEDALEDLGTRLAIARHRLAAELTDDPRLFKRAVEAELRDWDTYVERLRHRVAAGGSANEQSQLVINEVMSRRDDVARCLRELQTASDETWRERRERVDAALDELEHAADAF